MATLARRLTHSLVFPLRSPSLLADQENQQWYHRINGGTAGVDFWWNDEGETDYFTFWFWNLAEITGAKIVDATKRFWTINRSYSPGMHRIGGAVWTGDISVYNDHQNDFDPGFPFSLPTNAFATLPCRVVHITLLEIPC